MKSLTMVVTTDQWERKVVAEDRAAHYAKTIRNIIATGDNHAPAARRLVQILNIAETALEYDRENFLQPNQQQVAQALTQDG